MGRNEMEHFRLIQKFKLINKLLTLTILIADAKLLFYTTI